MSGPDGAPMQGGRFRNVHAPPRRPGSVLRWLLTRQRAAWPARIDNPAFPPPARVAAERIAATFIGHATFLLQVGGVTFLTDPIWSERASPVSFAGPKRVRAPAQPMAALPRVDVLLVSHCHYDHLDLPTLRAARRLWSPATVTGLGNARHLAKAGLGHIHECDWWQSVEIAGARITYLPAQHFSARTLLDRNRALWGGFMIEAAGRAVYFAGDSGDCPHFAEIGRRFPRIDLAILPIGAYEPRSIMAVHHMNPNEAVQAHRDLGALRSIGMHYGTFQLTDEPIDAPAKALAVALRDAGIPADRFGTLAFGETAYL